MAALQVGCVEVEPAALLECAPLRRGIAIIIVAFTVERGEGLVDAGQRGEHALATSNIGTPAISGHSVYAQREERMAVRRHQEPAAIAFLCTEEALSLERRPGQQPSVRVKRLLAALCQPSLELRLLAAIGSFELVIADDSLRPAAPRRLAISVDQAGIGCLEGEIVILYADPLDQQALRHVGLGDAQSHRADLLQVHLTGAAGQQQALAVIGPWHRWAGTHALAQRRAGGKRHHYRLRRPGRQVDAAGEVRPSLLCTVTSTVSAQSIALCRRKVRALPADQSHAHLAGSGPGLGVRPD